jgi:hypothetical protein
VRVGDAVEEAGAERDLLHAVGGEVTLRGRDRVFFRFFVSGVVLR